MAVQLPAQPPRNAAVGPRGSVRHVTVAVRPCCAPGDAAFLARLARHAFAERALQRCLAFALAAQHGGLDLYTLMKSATEETAVKKLPGSVEIWAQISQIPPSAISANAATRAAMVAVETKLFRPASNMRPLFGSSTVPGSLGEEDRDEAEEGDGLAHGLLGAHQEGPAKALNRSEPSKRGRDTLLLQRSF